MFQKYKLDIPAGEYEIGKIKDDFQSLSVEIILDDQVFVLSFEEKVLLRLMNESVISDKIFENCKYNWPVYIAKKDTEFLDFFYEQTGDVYKDWEYKHFRIIGQEEMIDIVSIDEPEITQK